MYCTNYNCQPMKFRPKEVDLTFLISHYLLYRYIGYWLALKASKPLKQYMLNYLYVGDFITE